MIKTKLPTNLLIFIFLISILTSCKREDIAPYAAIETFPNDTILPTIKNKKAMIVIAHDDDMCAMTGTISSLNKQGWEIRVLSISKGDSRNSAHRRACKNILDSVSFFAFSETDFRLDSSAVPYQAVPKNNFSHIFDRSLVKKEVIAQVNQYNPSVVFTLDNEMGGYGHPEHVFISQLVLDLAQADSIDTDYIYQSVYTDHMETTIMERHSKRMKSWGYPDDDWKQAKLTYGVKGMPEPSVQIDILEEAEAKMSFLRSYNKREREVIGFFIPAFEDYTAEEYFKVFNREFYKVIKIN